MKNKIFQRNAILIIIFTLTIPVQYFLINLFVGTFRIIFQTIVYLIITIFIISVILIFSYNLIKNTPTSIIIDNMLQIKTFFKTFTIDKNNIKSIERIEHNAIIIKFLQRNDIKNIKIIVSNDVIKELLSKNYSFNDNIIER